MILLPEEKSSDPNQISPFDQYAPAGSADRIAASDDSIRQQTYAVTPSSDSPLQGDSYDLELPPPAYESINDTGNSTHRPGIPNIDVKSGDTGPAREAFAVNPSGQADAGLPDTPLDTPPDTQSEPSEEPSVYARPPNVTEMIGAGASNAPPAYITPSGRTKVYPRYSSPSSFSGPPLPTPSRSLWSLVGGSADSPSQNQSPPIPPSFSRPLPQNLICDTFPPMYLIANGRHLDEGFPVVPPPSPVQPHPFSSRDVREVDWIRCVLSIVHATISLIERLDFSGI